jgi:hypothetical protein
MSSPPGRFPQSLHPHHHLGVLAVALDREHAFELSHGDPLYEGRFTHRGLAPVGGDLPPQPAKILDRLGAGGQEVDRVLERHRADALETAADLDPEIVGLGRDLVDEEEPSLGRAGSLDSHR